MHEPCIKHLEPAQEPNAGDASNSAQPSTLAATAAQQHLLQLQRELLLSTQPPADQHAGNPSAATAAGSGSTGFLTIATEHNTLDPAGNAGPAVAEAAGNGQAHGSYTTAPETNGSQLEGDQDSAAGSAHAEEGEADHGSTAGQQPSSWPRANLQQLLRMDSSDSTDNPDSSSSSGQDGEAVAWGGSCSGSQHTPAQEDASTPDAAADDGTGSQDSSPPLLQRAAASRFSFPGAGQQAVPLQYITPLKIPQPPAKCARQGGGQHIPGPSSRSSSPAGSYVGNTQQQNTHHFSRGRRTSGQQQGQGASGPGTNNHMAACAAALAGSKPGSSPCSRLPSPSAASSMSSEAAALLQALKLAAEQHRITQGVLTARSSLTSGFAAADFGSGGTADQATPSSRPQSIAPSGGPASQPSAPDGSHARHPMGSHPSTSARTAPMAAAAAGGAGERGRSQQHQQPQQQLYCGTSPSPRSSPGVSVQGPLGPLPRSPSVVLLQRSAAEALLADALDSSSFSSLMALLDSAAGSEDEDEVTQQQQESSKQPVQCQQIQEHTAQLHNQQQTQQQQQLGRAEGNGPATEPVVPDNGPASRGQAAAQHVSKAQEQPSSLPENHSAWGSCFSTPPGGNSRVPTPRETIGPEQSHCGTNQGAAPIAGQQFKQLKAQAMQLAAGRVHPHTEQNQQVQLQVQAQQRRPQPGSSGAGAGVCGQPSPPLNSAASGVASELVSEALSAELEDLVQQVEVERQQLEQLQQQRSSMELTMQGLQPAVAASDGSGTVQHQQQADQPNSSHGSDSAAAGSGVGVRAATIGPVVRVDAQAPAAATPDDVSPQSVYLECCEQQPSTKQPQGQSSRPPSPLPVDVVQSAAVQGATADAAAQCEATWQQQQQQQIEGHSGLGTEAGGVHESVSQAAVQCVEAECQASLLHVAGLPAVGPPIQCRCCPMLQTQLRETQQRLQTVMEQYKQVELHSLVIC